MAVKNTLDKIVERYPDIIGAMVIHEGTVHHNLKAPADALAVDEILETIGEIFEQTSMLEDEGYDFGDMILSIATHSLVVRSIEGGLLAILAPGLQRGQLVKLRVGLGPFGKAIEKSILEEAAQSTSVSTPAEAEKIEPSIDESDAMQSASDVSDAAERTEEIGFPSGGAFTRRRRGFRGTKQMIANRLDRAEEALNEPTPKASLEEQEFGESGIPCHPDGTPKKKQIYRGQVFWE